MEVVRVTNGFANGDATGTARSVTRRGRRQISGSQRSGGCCGERE